MQAHIEKLEKTLIDAQTLARTVVIKEAFDIANERVALIQEAIMNAKRLRFITNALSGVKWADVSALADLRPEDDKYITSDNFIESIDKVITKK